MLAEASAKKPILAIAGPTASGKSALGIALALDFGGEIINFDSVQLYRRLNIGTSKVHEEERRGIPHHLIDVIEPTDHFTAGDFAERARDLIAQIEIRGRMPVLVGGTGFYLRALREPLFDAPPTDLTLRSRLQRLHRRRGVRQLHRLLQRLDPKAAEEILLNDWSRITRALEYRIQTGLSSREQWVQRPATPDFVKRIRLLALHPPREDLYARINRRTEAMFERGWVDEVAALLRAGVPREAKAFGAHGYRRILQYLSGDFDLGRARELTAQDVRHYAKRQLTWLRAEADAIWLHGFGDDERIQREGAARVRVLVEETAP